MIRKGLAFVIGMSVITCALAFAQDAKPASRPDKWIVDQPVADFRLRDVMHDSKPNEKPGAAMVAISEFKGRKPVVLFFMSEQCSVTWRYEKRMGKLMSKYAKDVAFLGVRCSANDSPESLRKFAESRNFDMPVLNDEKGALSKFFRITNTPTFALVDKKGVLRYRGSFDDAPDEADVKHTYLADAVKAVLDSKEVAVKTTRPFG